MRVSGAPQILGQNDLARIKLSKDSRATGSFLDGFSGGTRGRVRQVVGKHSPSAGVFPMSNHRETASFTSLIDPQPFEKSPRSLMGGVESSCLSLLAEEELPPERRRWFHLPERKGPAEAGP
jgi:hypothetical protein